MGRRDVVRDLLLIAALAAAAYAPAVRFGFLDFEDRDFVWGNPAVTGGLTPAGVAWALSTTHTANWYPATWLSHMADWTLFGARAGLHHAVSILLHALNACLLFVWMRKTGGAEGRSLLVALLWALHPLRVESVAWVSSRKDVLSGVFFFLALIAWDGWVRGERRRRYALALALFAAGLAAKPVLMTFPLVLLILDGWPYGRLGSAQLRTLVAEKIPFFALSCVSVLFTLAANRAGWAGEMADAPAAGARFAGALISCAAYLKEAVWPVHLAPAHPFDGGPGWLALLVAAGVIAGMTGMAIAARRRRAWFAAGWGWYLVTLAPMSGIVQFGTQGRADRFTYIPFVGLSWLAVWAVAEGLSARGHRAARAALAFAAVAASLVLSVRQVSFWRDDATLFARALAVTPESAAAHFGMGSALVRRAERAGRTPAGLDEAERHYREALRLQPGFADANYALGLLLARSGRVGEAVPRFGEAARLKPGVVRYVYDYGQALAATGRREEAARQFEAALALDPAFADARRGLERLQRP